VVIGNESGSKISEMISKGCGKGKRGGSYLKTIHSELEQVINATKELQRVSTTST
jgi:hypothetical protein